MQSIERRGKESLQLDEMSDQTRHASWKSGNRELFPIQRELAGLHLKWGQKVRKKWLETRRKQVTKGLDTNMRWEKGPASANLSENGEGEVGAPDLSKKSQKERPEIDNLKGTKSRKVRWGTVGSKPPNISSSLGTGFLDRGVSSYCRIGNSWQKMIRSEGDRTPSRLVGSQLRYPLGYLSMASETRSGLHYSALLWCDVCVCPSFLSRSLFQSEIISFSSNLDPILYVLSRENDLPLSGQCGGYGSVR